jgi:cystathionine beta-lyase
LQLIVEIYQGGEMSTAQDFDAITIEDLRESGTTKWVRPDQAIGAFTAEMDFGVADEIKQALHEEVDKGLFAYLPPRYREEMQQAVAGFLERHADWKVDPARIHEMPDVVASYAAAIEHFSKPGSKIIVPTPAYMPFLFVPESLGREVIEVPMLVDEDTYSFRDDLAAIETAFDEGGDLLVLCNPHNPTGRVFTRDELKAIEELVDRKGGRVFSDEIWMPLVYKRNRHISYASIGDVAAGHTVTATAASKGFNLPGLKCAQLITSNDEDEQKWQEVGFMSMHGAANLGLVGTTAAFNNAEGWLDSAIEYLDENRKELIETVKTSMPKARVTDPEGTYVAWLDLRDYDFGDESAQEYLLREAGVMGTAGTACGKVGEGHLRFIFAMPRPIMRQALERIATALDKLEN